MVSTYVYLSNCNRVRKDTNVFIDSYSNSFSQGHYYDNCY